MLFSKNIEPKCIYCLRFSNLNEKDGICKKKGIIPKTYSCRSFSYDPFKRVPPEPNEIKRDEYTKEDFAI